MQSYSVQNQMRFIKSTDFAIFWIMRLSMQKTRCLMARSEIFLKNSQFYELFISTIAPELAAYE